MIAVFCGVCGAALPETGHPACEERLALEPPRFCAECGRRMIVQVTPTGWSAHCSRHGEIGDGR